MPAMPSTRRPSRKKTKVTKAATTGTRAAKGIKATKGAKTAKGSKPTRASKSKAVSLHEAKPLPRENVPLVFDRSGFTDTQLRRLYEALLLPRLIEEKMLKLLRQGQLSKWFSGIGQEAVAVGVTQALRDNDFILPLHRNLGVFTGRQMPLRRLFAQWQGKLQPNEGFTKGRDRSFHFGSLEHHVVGMISHLGSMLPVADGLALAAKLDRSKQVALVFSGDGGASEGDFHEALNVAAVWHLPVIFLVENNGYGLSTPSQQQFRCAQFVDKAVGYGVRGVSVDGNNVLDVVAAVRDIAAQMRKDSQPVLLEAHTFRMRGHEEASGTKYVPNSLMAAWAKKDPVTNYEQFLLAEGVLSEAKVATIRERLSADITAAWDEAAALPPATPASVTAEDEVADVYAPKGDSGEAVAAPEGSVPEQALEGPEHASDTPRKRFVDAVSEGLGAALELNDRLIFMGQDVAEYGGVFKVSEGFVKRFGDDRIRNTPICESVILGAALGLTMAGRPAVVEMQFADFVSCGFNQIVNNLAKTHYRWGHPVNVTVRMPTGAGVGAGPFHSQSTEAWFTHVPGLKVVYPATPHAAKGLMLASIQDPNPVLFFEHKQLYRSLEGSVPDDAFTVPLGQARVALAADDAAVGLAAVAKATVVTYGAAVHWAMEAVATLEQEGDIAVGTVEVIDLQTLVPWDRDTVFASVRRTNRCLVLHEATLQGGFGGELAAAIGSACFEHLDAPVMRLASLDTPVPFNRALEATFLPKDRVSAALAELLAY